MNHLSSRYINFSCYKTEKILLSVVAHTISLRKCGKSNVIITGNKAGTYHKCRCPFHNDKTPSFHLYQIKSKDIWLYKCLGCGKAGDVFSFLMNYYYWDFWQAAVYVLRQHKTKQPISPLQLLIPFPDLALESS